MGGAVGGGMETICRSHPGLAQTCQQYWNDDVKSLALGCNRYEKTLGNMQFLMNKPSKELRDLFTNYKCCVLYKSFTTIMFWESEAGEGETFGVAQERRVSCG